MEFLFILFWFCGFLESCRRLNQEEEIPLFLAIFISIFWYVLIPMWVFNKVFDDLIERLIERKQLKRRD